MNSLPPKLELRTDDAQPIGLHVLKEIVEMRRELCKRLDQTEAIICEIVADLRVAQDRIDKIERKLAQ